MNEELIKHLKFLSEQVKDLEAQLKVIDDLLGSPHTAQFSEQVLSSIVDDTLRLQMMHNDIVKHGANCLAGEFGRMLSERMNNFTFADYLEMRRKRDGN